MKWFGALMIGCLLATSAAAQQPERIEIDQCVWKCTKGGRYRSMLVTPELYIVSIDANRCPDQSYHCPSSYASFTTDDGVPVEVKGYVPGEKTTEVFNVYVPRGNRYLYVHGINSGDRSHVLDLAALVEGERASSMEPPIAAPGETSIDDLYRIFIEGYAQLDADKVAGLYTEDAIYLSPGGDARRGRPAIREWFSRMFRGAEERGENLELSFETVERRVQGSLAYEVGYFTLTRVGSERAGTSRAKFVVVLKRIPGAGWRLHVDGYSDAD